MFDPTARRCYDCQKAYHFVSKSLLWPCYLPTKDKRIGNKSKGNKDFEYGPKEALYRVSVEKTERMKLKI